MDEVRLERNLSKIANSMDGEKEVFITDKVGKAFLKLREALDIFSEAKDVLINERKEWGDDAYDELWTLCEEEDEEFYELFDILKNVETAVDALE